MLAAESIYDLVSEAVVGRMQVFVGSPPFNIDDVVAIYDTGTGYGAEVNGSDMEVANVLVLVRSKKYKDGSDVIEDIYKHLNNKERDEYKYKEDAYIIMIRANRPPGYEGQDARQRHIFTQLFTVRREVK